MICDIESLKQKSKKEIETITDLELFNQIKIKYLGRNGIIANITKSLPQLQLEERKKIGYDINLFKKELIELLNSKEKELKKSFYIKEISKEKIDKTLPGIPVCFCNEHPINQTIQEIVEIFISFGFNVALGPEIETDYYNFTALNIPEFHPARDMQDTLYIDSKEKILLRTHTSPVQIRIMEKYPPPVRIVIPGKVYRHEAVDATHSFMFHQIEGLAVDENITFGDLKGILTMFSQRMFGTNIKVIFKPSYFPFTEPSAEMYIECIICKGNGCRVCKNTGFLEMLGCGMVHPKLFDNVNYNKNKFSGFAFGLGVERFAMLKYRIDDMRIFYENDLRFLNP